MRIAFRQLIKTPGFTIVALLTLALGIGVNTTAFTVLNRLLFVSLPYPEPDRLVQIWGTSPRWQYMPQAPGDYCDLRDQNTVFQHIAAFYPNYQASLAESGRPLERSVTMIVTADFFPLLGIPPVLGRTFTADEGKRRQPVVVLTNAYWQKHFQGDPRVLGRTLRLDTNTVTIVGVMPPRLDDPQLWGAKIDLWCLDNPDENRQYREKAWYWIMARLKPGATVGQAQAEVTAIAARLAHDYPKTNDQRGQRVAPFTPDFIGDLGRSLTWLIMGLSFAVLLIACVNLANLQLIRTTARTREFAVRLALGASRGQLMRLLLTESLLLSLTGGALGLLAAKWGNAYFAAFFDIDMPLNLRVMTFAFAVSALTGVAFGVVPAWLASRSDVNTAIKQGGRGSSADRSRHRLRHGLIVAELALALTLLTGAGYFVRGIQRITSRELGWRAENLLIGNFTLPPERYGDDKDIRSLLFKDKFLAALRLLPGVDHASISTGTPASGISGGMAFLLEGHAPPPRGKEPGASYGLVTPEFFDTYGIRLLHGRGFTDADRPESPAVVIINQAMAEKFWPGENPIGKRIGDADPAHPGWLEVVGIVNDIIPAGDLGSAGVRFQIYRPWSQSSLRFFTFTLHSATDPRTLGDGARRILAGFEPDVAINQMTTAQEVMTANLSGFSLVRRTLAQLAGLGLLLSVVGIYGVIANLAMERTQEVGIRMALGAQTRDVIWLFLRNGIFLALLGTAIGVLTSFGLMRILNQTVAILPGNDPWVVVGLAAFLGGVAVIACWLPARRATKVNPVVALRAE